MASAVHRVGVWGIDLGQCALKAIRLELEDGEIKATAFDYIEHPKILSQPDADPDQLTREALELFLSRNELKGDLVAISVPGQSGLARFVKLPPVDEKKIPDIVRFEAKQQIPFPLDEVVWGFQRLGAGTTSDNMVLDAEIGLFAMKRDMVNRYLQHFKDVEVEVHYIQMAPLALCNFLAHDRLGKGAANESRGDDEEQAGDKECVVGLDIGTDNSNLVITDGEKIIWQRPIPLGGNHFTRALTKDLKLTFAKAEHLKRNAVKSPELRKILAALKPVLNDFVSEVQRSLGYFTNTHRDATIKYMLGLGNAFRLPGLQKYLQEKLQLEVRKLQKIERLSGEEAVTDEPQYAENVLSFAVAHGLALQGLQSTRIYTNLLPPEIAAERAVRAKKPWAVAAAAVLLLMSPPLLLGWSATKQAWNNPGVTEAQKALENVVKVAKKEVNDYQTYEREVNDYRKKVLDLAGGVNGRLTWLHINNYLNEALPRPDGTRLVETARNNARPRQRYFIGDQKGSGQRANELWQRLKMKLLQGSALTREEQQSEEEIKKFLVQVNIESVITLYSDNLPSEFFLPLTSDTNKLGAQLYGLTDEQKKGIKDRNVPKIGWVIEIRGYTYHEDKNVFVLNSLVENLVDLADKDKKSRQLQHAMLHPETEKALHFKDKDVLKPRVSHVILYDYSVDTNPQPGVFHLIYKTSLGPMMGYLGPRGGFFAPPPKEVAKDNPDDPKGAAPPPPPPPARVSWRPPSGTMVGESFMQAGTKGPAPTTPQPATKAAKGPNAPEPLRRTPRTEFVIMIVWQDPPLLP